MDLNDILSNKVARQLAINEISQSTNLYLLTAKSYLQKNGKIISKTVGMISKNLIFSRICDYGTALDRKNKKPYSISFRFYEKSPNNTLLSTPVYDTNGEETNNLNIIFHDASKLFKTKKRS